MKYDNLASFQRHVENTHKSGQFPPIYLFLSADMALSRWMMHWMAPFFKVEVSTSFEDLTPSLFSKEKLLMLEIDQLLPAIESYVPQNGTTLLLALPKLESTSPFYKKVEKLGVVLQPATLKPWEKESFFIDVLLRRSNGLLANDAAKAIVTRCGGDPFLIDAAYEKLILFSANERKITLADVNLLGPFDEEETLFHFTDALFLKKGGEAQVIGQKLLDQGSNPLALLKTYRTQCTLLYELKVSLESVTAKHAYLKGNILEQKLTQARAYSPSDLKHLLLQVDELERFYKSTSVTDEVFLEYAVVSLLR